MSDDTKTGGAGDNQKSGANSDQGAKDQVSHETYLKVMDELKESQRKLKAIEDKQKSESESKLKEQGEWKTLAEAREKEANEAKEKLTATETAIADSIKLSAFQKHLGGKLKNDKYFDFVDTSTIAWNPETKKVDEASVKLVVASFLKEHSHLVDFGKRGTMPRNTKVDGKEISGGKSIAEMSSKEYEEHLLAKWKAGEIKE